MNLNFNQGRQNISPYYPIMLMSTALMRVIHLWDKGELPSSFDDLIKKKLLIVLFQALTRALQSQNSDRSWGVNHFCKESAYVFIFLNELITLPCVRLLHSSVDAAIKRGQRFITKNQNDIRTPEYLRIEKVTYSSPMLSKAYILAALRANPFRKAS